MLGTGPELDGDGDGDGEGPTECSHELGCGEASPELNEFVFGLGAHEVLETEEYWEGAWVGHWCCRSVVGRLDCALSLGSVLFAMDCGAEVVQDLCLHIAGDWKGSMYPPRTAT